MFRDYPYTNLQDLNLDWILRTIKAMVKEMNEFIVTNSIKYADPFQWSIVRQYEKNTITIDPLSGIAYLSTQAVPSGVNISNTDYWTPVFDLSALFTAFNGNLTRNDEADNITSSQNYAIDDWLIWHNELYRVNTAISTGDALANADIVRVTVEDYIVSLQSDMTNAQNDISTAQNDITNAQNDIIALQADVAKVKYSAERTTRPKLAWYTGDTVQVIGCDSFDMLGFRYDGQYKKTEHKHREVEDSYKYNGGCLVPRANMEVINSEEKDCWYGIFMVETSDTKCAPAVAPIFRITANSGNSFTLGICKEGQKSAAMTSTLKDVTGRDVLIITEGGAGAISARVTKITSNTSNSVEFEDKGSLAIDDYIMIAPADEYEYIASHYTDTVDWRNRGDNGFLVKSYGISVPVYYDSGLTNNGDMMNTISPMASGVYCILFGTDGTSTTGNFYFQIGADDSHIDSYDVLQKAIGTSFGFLSCPVSANFDYTNKLSHKVVSPDAVQYRVRCQGYYE